MQDDADLSRPKLSDWILAFDRRHENPVILLARQRKNAGRQSIGSLLVANSQYLATAILAAVLAYLLIGSYAIDSKHAATIYWVLIALSVASHWVFICLYSAAKRGLAMIAEPASLGKSEFVLDRAGLGMMRSREVLFGLVWVVLPGILQALVIACFLTGAWQGAYTHFNQLIASDLPEKLGGGIASPDLIQSWLFLVLFALPGSLIYILWLVVLGRSIKVLWQYYALAFVAALTQFAWIPLSYTVRENWYRIEFGDPSVGFVPLLAVFVAAALFVLVLLISIEKPQLRMAVALAVPVMAVTLLIAASMIGNHIPGQDAAGPRLYIWSNWIINTGWALSAFSVVNPFVLQETALGFDSGSGYIFHGFEWYRVPGIILMQLFNLFVLSTVATQAVEHWRVSAE